MKTKINIKELVVVKNFFYLSLMKISSLALPLLTTPYLIRVIGFDNVGSINLAATFMMYLCIIVSYSYIFTGAKFISENRYDTYKLNEYYSTSMSVRLWLLILSLIILITIVTCVPNYRNSELLFYLSFGIVMSHFLMPTWVFQGFETMKYITYVDLFSKLIFTILIFTYVNDRNDFYLVPLYNSLGSCIAGFISLYIIRFKFNLKIDFKSFLNFRRIMWSFKIGKDVFIQQVYVSLYGPITILFLGALSSDISVGYFTVAEKIIYIPLTLVLVAVQAYYPYAVRLYNENIYKYYVQLKYLIATIFIFMACVSALLSFYSQEVYVIITGAKNEHGLLIFNILLIGLSFSALGQLLTQVFVTANKMRVLKKISFSIMIITLTLTPLIIIKYDVLGLAIYTVIRQLIVITLCLYQIIKLRNESLGKVHV